MRSFPHLIAGMVAGWLGCSLALAESGALIVTGLPGSSANAEEFQRLALETRRLLAERGIPAGRIVVAEDARRDGILDALRAAAKDVAAADEFWLVLYGHGGRTRGDAPAFQVRGPRLTADDLDAALDAIPAARQFVVIGTSESGAFLPVLQDSRRAVVAATKGAGESDQPRFPAAWVSALAENPRAAFAWVAARAAQLVSAEYDTASLAQLEHARLADPTTGRILEPPFGVDLAVASGEIVRSPAAAPPAVAAPIKVEIRDPQAEWERQPATEETKKIVAEARVRPNPAGHAALVLEQRLGFTVEDNRTTDRTVAYRVFIARDDAADAWANFPLPQAPPLVTTKLEYARVIRPDGSSTVFNPARLPGATNGDETGDAARAVVFLPDAGAGCVVEIAWRTRQMLNATLPHVSEEWPLQADVPVLATQLEVRVPDRPEYRVGLNHVDARPVERTEHGRRIATWQLGPLPAAEALPGDAPAPLWAASLAISSLSSWDEFATWYRRMADGSDVIDDSVEKAAVEVMGGGSRSEKIRRAFEFVSALRYLTVAFGVQGIRPRPPARVLASRYGDCKDKANLLGAMLRSQGIDARFVLLNRGSFTDVKFPSWQFNHAICHVPGAPGTDQPDDLWLDATDGTTPFGFVPPGDHGRAGLVLGPETAEFKTVETKNARASELRDDWTLTETEAGGWIGAFQRTATGFAEDELRRQFRGLTPAQRQVILHRTVAPLWLPAEFSAVSVSDTSDLAAAPELRARVVTARPGLPPGEFPAMEMFAAPERDRPLWLNDGQPLVFTQTVRLRYRAAPTEPPAAWHREVAGQTLGITWRRIDAHTLERTSRIELRRPIVAAADYAAVRRGLRDWTAALR